ncbi:MAG: surface-adhesin E family protein [Hyphomonadaceae bacterium]
MYRSGIAFLLSLCFSVCVSNAFAQDSSEWVEAGAGEDTLYFIDSKSVRGENDYLVGWAFRYNNDLSYVVNGKLVGFSLVKFAWNCHTDKIASITTTTYDRSKRLIKSGNDIPEYGYNWQYVVPGSVGQNSLAVACYYAPDESYYSDLPDVIRRRRELELLDYYVAESVGELIEYANQVMPWTEQQSTSVPRGKTPKQASLKRKK